MYKILPQLTSYKKRAHKEEKIKKKKETSTEYKKQGIAHPSTDRVNINQEFYFEQNNPSSMKEIWQYFKVNKLLFEKLILGSKKLLGKSYSEKY